MSVGITVKYYRSNIVEPLQSYDLRVYVDSATDMPKEIFVFQQGLAPAYEGGGPATDRFICLADPVDLEEWPVGAPALDAEIPYFRTREVTLRFRSMQELEDTRILIDEDIQRLVNALKAAANLPLVETKTYA
jgi:hypothetical protein